MLPTQEVRCPSNATRALVWRAMDERVPVEHRSDCSPLAVLQLSLLAAPRTNGGSLGSSAMHAWDIIRGRRAAGAAAYMLRGKRSVEQPSPRPFSPTYAVENIMLDGVSGRGWRRYRARFFFGPSLRYDVLSACIQANRLFRPSRHLLSNYWR